MALPKLTKSLKSITSKRANPILAMTGSCFWQEESYDHLVRNEREFEKIRCYIEENPVRAGLVRESHWWPIGGQTSSFPNTAKPIIETLRMSIGGRARDG